MTIGDRSLNAEMVYFLFDSANMHRWNDHLRTIDLTELDKQAHKASIAWVLGKYEESEGNSVDWRRIIEHSLFSFIERMAMTDLKPQVFHRIKREKSKEVVEFVLKSFDEAVPSMDNRFRGRLEAYLKGDRGTFEDGIIDAAHYLATRWEFNLIRDANKERYGIEQTRKEIDSQVFRYLNFIGVKRLMAGQEASDFVDLIGQLRFQQRWARTPRIPRTTVLGHSLFVADLMFLSDLDEDADPRQIYNDFYSALFHDLPEVLTKDVISPVKMNVDGLSKLLEDYEREMVEERIMPLIPMDWHDDLRCMVYDPFTDMEDPTMGRRRGLDLKSCDRLAAYIEAHVSISYGISSKSLREGERELEEKLFESGEGICARGLIEDFKRLMI